jgi:hypothetical protein
MNISIGTVRQITSPLGLIFWGGLICVFDFKVSQTVNGEGWTFDIVNDLVGMLMITRGVFQLAKIDLHDRYRKAMSFVRVVAILSCIEAFHGHFIYDTPTPTVLFFTVLGVAAMIATVVFCVSMRWLSQEANLVRSAISWKMTTLLFVVIYLIPLGLFYCASTIAIVTETSFNIDLGPAGLFLIPVFFIPLIHLFVSTSRMKSDAATLRPPEQTLEHDWNEEK